MVAPSAEDCLEDESLLDLPALNLSAPKPVKIEPPNTNSTLNFLVIATTTGLVHLYAFGTLLSGSVNLMDYLGADQRENVKILSARLSPSFDTLFVQLQIDTELCTLILANPFLAENATALLELSRRHCQILEAMLYVDDVIVAIKEAWETVLLEMDTKLTKYGESVPPGSVSADFIVLLVFGKASPELEHFLLHDLTDKGLKKLGNCIELSYTTIQKLVMHPLQTAVLQACSHLNGLRGLSRNRRCFGRLLLEPVIEDALQRGGSFLLKAFELQQTIDQSTRDYKIFFRWLYAVIMALLEDNVPDDISQMTQQELNYLSQFLATLDDDEDGIRDTFKRPDQLQRKFNLEKVGQYLEDKPLAEECVSAPTDWQRMVAQNECIRNSPLIYKHEERASLVQQFKALQQKVSVIFEQQQSVISSGFQTPLVIPHHHLEGIGDGNAISVRSLNQFSAAGEALNYFIYHVSGKCFWFFIGGGGGGAKKEESSDTHPTHRCKKFQFDHIPFYYNSRFTGAEFEFLDLQFYNEETVSVLLRCTIRGEEKRVYFLQLPISSLLTTRTNFYEVMDPDCLKLVDGVEWRYLAVSGNRKVCTFLSENRKRVCVFETEAEDDEDEEMENSNHLDESK